MNDCTAYETGSKKRLCAQFCYEIIVPTSVFSLCSSRGLWVVLVLKHVDWCRITRASERVMWKYKEMSGEGLLRNTPVKSTVSPLKRNIKEAKGRKDFFFSSLSALFLSHFFFFPFQDEEEKKTRAGEQQRQKQVSVSGGTGVERWIRPGFGRVKWASAIKSRQAERQEPLSSELKANTEGQWRVHEGVEIVACVCVWGGAAGQCALA